MKRRVLLRAGCAGCLALAGLARAQEKEAWQPPARFTRPDAASDEGGLWASMDRAEASLRRSPFRVRDKSLEATVQGIACRLGEAHCPDIRVYLMHTAYFNASMAPNGMMQVWSGLMLRADNEAQLAAVLGHEIGHYLQRHSVERLRDAKARTAFSQLAGMLGPVGLVAGLGTMAGMYSYSREHESEADRIGALLMQRAGYDVAEAAKVWANLLLEVQAKPSGSSASPLFATHPPPEDRESALRALAAQYLGGTTEEQAWQRSLAPFVHEWLNDEIKRGQHEESLVFLSRAVGRTAGKSEYLFARGEVYRLRARESDFDEQSALDDFRAAIAAGNEPPQTHRSLGLIYRARKDAAAAQASFARYLELAPQAPDAAMVRAYIEELRT
jgi:predicted Zn-dependent protease